MAWTASARSEEASTAEAVAGMARQWWLVLALGIALAVVGVFLLFNLVSAAFTLALLVALGFLLEGVSQVAQADRHVMRWPAYVLGAVLIITGIIALTWPGITLWALAVVTGLGIIVFGLVQVAAAVALRRAAPAWGVWLAVGIISVAVGVLCIAWPGATVAVLAILLGLRVAVQRDRHHHLRPRPAPHPHRPGLIAARPRAQISRGPLRPGIRGPGARPG